MTWTSFWSIVRDVLSLGLAALGSYLAYAAVKMGREQGRIAHEQHAIAKLQHQITQEQLDRKAVLHLVSGKFEIPRFENFVIVHTLRLHNSGTASAHNVFWSIEVPTHRGMTVSASACEGSMLQGENYDHHDLATTLPYEGFCSYPIHRDGYVDIVDVRVEMREGDDTTLEVDRVFWALNADFGRWPSTGSLTTELPTWTKSVQERIRS